MLNPINNTSKNEMAELYENCQNYEEVKLIRNYYSEEITEKSLIKDEKNKAIFEQTYLIDRCE